MTINPRPVINKVLDSSWQITLPMPTSMKNVNVYLLEDGPDWVMIDSGLGTPEAWEILCDSMKALSIPFSRLSKIILTHPHLDHIGLAGNVLQEAPNAAPFMHKLAFEQMQDHWLDPDFKAFRSFKGSFIQNGMPEEKAERCLQNGILVSKFVHAPSTCSYIDEKDEIVIGCRSYQVLWTPGHSDGHICLFSVKDGILIGGDHILRTITPHIGLYPGCRNNPLQDYLLSLDRLSHFNIQLILPGHGAPFTTAQERIAQIQDHHQQRCAEIKNLLMKTAQNAFEIAQVLFEKRFDSPENQQLAIAETFAHLEYLRMAKALDVHTTGSTRFYSLSTA